MRKRNCCCRKCENHKFAWTVVFVFIGLIFLLGNIVMPKMPGAEYTLNFGVEKIFREVRGLDFANLDFANPVIVGYLAIGGVVALGILVLIIATFKHLFSKKCERKQRKEVPSETNEGGNGTSTLQQGVAYIPYMINGTVQLVPVAVPGVVQPQQPVTQVNQPVVPGVQPVYIYSQMGNQGTTGSHVATYANPYNPGVYEDIESPYNMYRTGRGNETYNHRRGRGFLKFLGVLLVLAAAYLFLAYKIQSVDFFNLFKH